MRSSLWSLTLLVAVVTVTGCEGHACTAVGGSNGIGLEIARELWVPEGDVAITACDDDGCESTTKHLALLTKGQGGSHPQERGQIASFKDLGRSFDDGPVHVTVELRDSGGQLVARREDDVELTRYWPNGKACDGDGFVGGGLDLRAGDAVVAPA